VQRPLRLWKYLPEYGITAHVVCSSQAGADASKANVSYMPDGAPASLRLKAQLAGAQLMHRIIPHNERIPWVPHAVAEADRLVKRFPISAVFSTFPPLGSHLAAMWTAARHNLKWVADFRDPMYGNAFRLRKGLIQHERFFERRIFPRAAALVAVTDEIRNLWVESYPQYQHKYHVIWNGFDPEEPFPAPTGRRNSRRTILHAGNIYGHRHPQHLLASLERLIGNGRLDPQSITVDLLGPVQEPPEVTPLDSFKRLKELGCLTYNRKNVPRAESLQHMADTDYLLIMDINELNIGHSVPAKLFDYIRARKPIIGLVPPGSIVRRILDRAEVKSLFIYPEDSAEEQDRKLAEFLAPAPGGVDANEWFRETFDGRRQAGAVADLVRSL
jgi:glycosyltransferase involved in cell wall biosynthesis